MVNSTSPETEGKRRLSSVAPDSKLRGYVFTALFAGTAIATGYILMSIPNVEAITAILFIAGFTLGISKGIIAAIITALIYFGFNPQGGFFPPLLIAQILGLCIAPVAGALFFRISRNRKLRLLVLAIMAILSTLGYDILTNLAFPLAAGFDLRGIFATLIAAVPFTVIHVAVSYTHLTLPTN